MTGEPKKVIVLTGGGTAGHVMPHLALLPYLQERWRVVYIGTVGIEKQLIENRNVEFHSIVAGKLRRYFSWENFSDIFKLFWGTVQSYWILLRVRPFVVLSKGGFVSVPVAVAAWLLRIPVITHESDLTPGLANRLIAPFSYKILYSFPETGRFLSSAKSQYVGSPVRDEILRGDAVKGVQFCGFRADDPRPIVLVMGGSQGAHNINQAVIEALPVLLPLVRVVLLCGKGKNTGTTADGFAIFEYVDRELPDVFACSSLVICRAGANTLFELLALKKPMILVPLTVGSRGDQLDNAHSFEAKNWARVLLEKDLNPASLKAAVEMAMHESAAMRSAMQTTASQPSSHDAIMTNLTQLI